MFGWVYRVRCMNTLDNERPCTPFFRIDRPGDANCMLGRALREAEHALFSPFSKDDTCIEDFDLAVDRLAQQTGHAKTVIRGGILAYNRLVDLPQLRALQDEHTRLSLGHLRAIHRKIDELGPEADEELLADIDAYLADLFTPTKPNQPFPDPAAVTRKLREEIRRIDPGLSYLPRRRRQREAQRENSAEFTHESFGGRRKGVLFLTTDTTTLSAVRAFVEETAREHSLSLHDAVIGLLSGTYSPAAKANIQVYAPKGRKAGEPVFIPGFGWTDPEATVAFDEMCEQVPPRTVDLEAAASAKTDSYTPTAAMRALAEARDGTCCYPGCSRPAHTCQLDHRIPFGEGGETCVDNLCCLCQKHHNVKTDKQAFYVPDPATGDIIWLYEDGHYEIAESEGILDQQLGTPHPRWVSSLEAVKQNRAKMAEFNARGHAIMDQYDRDGDVVSCELALAELEDAFGMCFQFHPDPETMVPQRAPDEEEPPFPDYEFENNPDNYCIDDANLPLPTAG